MIVNPTGLSFHSVAVLDALLMSKRPVVELHLSNIHAKDAVHRHSIMSAAATLVICEFGVDVDIVTLLVAVRLIDPLGGAVPNAIPNCPV